MREESKRGGALGGKGNLRSEEEKRKNNRTGWGSPPAREIDA